MRTSRANLAWLAALALAGCGPADDDVPAFVPADGPLSDPWPTPDAAADRVVSCGIPHPIPVDPPVTTFTEPCPAAWNGFCLEARDSSWRGGGLARLWGMGAGDLWAGGGDGRLFHWDGQRWLDHTDMCNFNARAFEFGVLRQGVFTGFAGDGPGRVLTVGARLVSNGFGSQFEGGFALRWDGARWTPDDLRELPEGGLTALWDSPGGQQWLGADRGRLFRREGTHWQPVDNSVPTADAVVAIWGSRDDLIYLAADGNEATVWSGDGTTWKREGVLEKGTAITALHGSGATDVWMAGEGLDGRGIFHKRRSWSLALAGPYQAVFAVSERDVWAAGEAGRVAHYDGGRWTEFRLEYDMKHTADDLLAVWATATDVWIAGSGFSVFHFKR